MKKISTFILLVSVLWYAATTSGNITAIIVAIIVTLTAFPIWAYVIAKKTGRNPWKWALLSILLPLIGPLVLFVTARKDILEATHREMTESKKGFWERKFGKFGGLIPYVAALLLVLTMFGLTKLGISPLLSSSVAHHTDMSYDVTNGNETANLVNGGLWLKTNSFELFANMEDGGKIYAINTSTNGNVYKYSDDSASNLCELKGYIYYINKSDHDRIYRLDTSKEVQSEKVTNDSVEQFCIADRIYYINKNDKNRIYCINKNGEGGKKLSINRASDIFQNYEKLFYINPDDNHIYEMTIEGKDNKKFIEDRAGQIFIQSNRIYYIALDDGNRVYSVTPEGKERRKENDYAADCLNFDGSALFFTNKNDQDRVYMLEGMSGKLTKLSDDPYCTDLNLIFCSGVMYSSSGKQKFVNVYNVTSPVEYFPGMSSMYGGTQANQQPQPANSNPAPSPETVSAPLSPPSPQPDAFARNNVDTPLSGKQVWPDYLPKDIPPIPANINLVQADQISIRIWFNNLPQSDFLSYLELLKDNDFSLVYIIYQQPGETLTDADINRLTAEGKFDAVRISKGKYNFYIEYGANGGTYDLNSRDFLDPSVIHS